MNSYTVVLLYPLEMQGNPEAPSSYMTTVQALNPPQAARFAQDEAARSVGYSGVSCDFYPVCVIAGEHKDLLQ